MQNPSIFRTASIFRTLAYLEPEAYSEHCQTCVMKRFATWRIFSPSSKKQKKITPRKWNFLALMLKKLLIFSRKKTLLILQETKSQKRFSYISGNGSSKKNFLYFRKRNLQSPKNKQKICYEEISCLF